MVDLEWDLLSYFTKNPQEIRYSEGVEEPPSSLLPRQISIIVLLCFVLFIVSQAFASTSFFSSQYAYAPIIAALILLACNSFFTMAVAAMAASRAGNGTRLRLLASAQLGQSFSALGFAIFAIPFTATLLPRFLTTIFSSLEQRPTLFSSIESLSLLLAWICLAFLYALLRQSLKGYAEARYDMLLPRFKPILQVWHGMVAPLVMLLLRAYRLTFGWIGVEEKGVTSQSEKLRALLRDELEPNNEAQDARERSLAAESQKLLHNVLNFSDKQIKDIMVPRTDVVWIDIEKSFAETLERVNTSGYTRFPLCQGSPDEVIGYIHAKDIIRQQIAKQEGQAVEVLQNLVRPVSFIPDTAPAPKVLAALQHEYRHFAIVLDEFGGMKGLLTLEDLLEELVGDIRDEFDAEEEEEIQKIADNHYLVDGQMRLDDVSQELNLDFGEVEEDTIGGYIFARLAQEQSLTGQSIALQNRRIQMAGAELQVAKADNLRITQVQIRLQKQTATLTHSA